MVDLIAMVIVDYGSTVIVFSGISDFFFKVAFASRHYCNPVPAKQQQK